MTLVEAIEAQLRIDRFLKQNGIADLTADYGEQIAQGTLGGALMPPTNTGYDIIHDRFGRLQVKTRRLSPRTGGRKNTETWAVLSTTQGFDFLFHLVLREDYRVQAAALAPADEVSEITGSNSGKIRIEQTLGLPSALNFTNEADQTERRLREDFGVAPEHEAVLRS